MAPRLKNYINGKWQEPSSKKYLDSINPATEQLIAKVPKSTKKDVNQAVNAAKKAFPKWRLTPAPKRAELLYKVVELLKKEKPRLGKLMTQEMGKILTESLGDIQEAIDIGELMAGEGRRLYGQTFKSELANKDIISIRQPIGVFALVTPWNFPIAIPCWKLFPALVAGNTVVFKPSQYVAACGYELIKLFDKAGFPKGVVNMVLGSGKETGDDLVCNNDVKAISFTGSTAVGKHIGEIAGKQLKKHSLELGGKNCVVVMDDANIDLAVDGCIWAGFGTSGQRCTAGSRVIVHKKVHDEFVKKFVKATKKLKIGNGLKKDIFIGPLINNEQLEKVKKYAEIARKEDKVKVECGGKKANIKKGFFFEPTVLTKVKPHHRVAQEEIFGPVVAVIKVSSFEEAIKVANGVDYGLSAAIFTQDVNRAHIAQRDLESGIVYINSATIGAEVTAPFGGVKGTGNGHREAGGMMGAIDTYTEIKVINTDYSGSIQKAQAVQWATKKK